MIHEKFEHKKWSIITFYNSGRTEQKRYIVEDTLQENRIISEDNESILDEFPKDIPGDESSLILGKILEFIWRNSWTNHWNVIKKSFLEKFKK